MPGPRGRKPDNGIGNLRGSGQSLPKRHECFDFSSGRHWVWLAGKPTLILERITFGRNHGVHPDLVDCESQSPFASEGIDSPFGGGISAGATLTGLGDF